MVFGLFSRKPTQPDDAASPDPHQLRTPSPSTKSGSAPHPTHSPLYPQDMLSPAPPPPATPSPPPHTDADIAALRDLIRSVPPKILHSYILSHLPSPSSSTSTSTSPPITITPHTLPTLSTFFSLLSPPPLLHCVRCHSDFFDIDNNDHSCLVPHDDDSAEVERVGWSGRASKGAGRKRGEISAEYETLWGCCGKTVEGDGDMGPPDGWCYEGKHTTDPKRARFRADSTIHHDKLTSCLKLNCHGIRDQLPTSARLPSTRKRIRKTSNLREHHTASEDEDEGSDGEEDSGVEEIVKRGRQNEQSDVHPETDADAQSVTSAPSSIPSTRGRPPKRTLSTTTPASHSKSTPASTSKPTQKPTSKSQVRNTPNAKARKGRGVVVSDTDRSAMDVDRGSPSRVSPSRARPVSRSRARPISKRPAKKSSADADAPDGNKTADSPPRRTLPRTRSRSRLGVRNSNSFVGSIANANDESEQPKKRRKVVA